MDPFILPYQGAQDLDRAVAVGTEPVPDPGVELGDLAGLPGGVIEGAVGRPN